MANDDRNWNLAAPTGGGSGSVNGHTAFGTVPNAISVPQNIFSQVNGAIPNFGNLTGGTSNVINSELQGNVSPATLKAMKNAAATFGVANGVPGSGLENNNLFGNIAGFSEAQQRKGVEDYNGTLNTVGRTMTDPNLAAEIASRNATLASAPDPKLAAEEQMRQWLQKFGLTSALGNLNGLGPNGGTGAFRGGRPPDAPSYGGYRGRTDALGNPVTDMSGGAMGSAYWGAGNPVGYGPTTEHFSAGAGGALNPAFTVPGSHGYFYAGDTNGMPNNWRQPNDQPENLFTQGETDQAAFDPYYLGDE